MSWYFLPFGTLGMMSDLCDFNLTKAKEISQWQGPLYGNHSSSACLSTVKLTAVKYNQQDSASSDGTIH